jgi:SAM-dependent methyltransferase
MSDPYVHGYTNREARRLGDQAGTLAELLHEGTRYPAGAKVLEAGCGVGSQTRFLVEGSPEARFTCLDISPEFVCFVLEHLTRPVEALAGLARLVKPGGSVTVIEGDHGSCYFHPEGVLARRAWQCLIDCQAALGGDSLIGRRLYPLMVQAGVRQVRVGPRAVYCDDSRPAWVEGFVRRTIIPMVEGVRETALAEGMMSPEEWAEGIAQLHQTATAQGSFLYTFFKGVGVAPAA